MMQKIDVFNPATGAYSGSVACSGPAEIAAMAVRARRAQADWARQSFRSRAQVIARFHDRMLASAPRILDAIQSETGKARRDALSEIVTVAGTVHYYLARGGRWLAPKRRRGAIPGLTRAVLEHRPHGVVALITPWNYPFLLPIADAIPALLAGNAVIVKPSELTPLSAVLGRELLVESGLDPDLLGIVHGAAEAGRELIAQADYLGFTGGNETGRKAAADAAVRMIPFSLELGGKNPMVVLRDAPLAAAAQALLAGAFANSGQACISIERVYVEAPVFDRFARLVAEGAARLKLGASADWDVDMGSLIHAGHAARVMEQVQQAVRAGASVLAGARRREDLGAAFVAPTVLADVSPHSSVATQETFGPVVTLTRAADARAAIAMANDSPYGLNASVWAGGSARALDTARGIEAGSVGIHSALMIYNTFDVPMGGVKQSGVGRRHGEDGILRYTRTRSIVRSFGSGGGYDSLLLRIRTAGIANAVLKLLYWRRRIPWI